MIKAGRFLRDSVRDSDARIQAVESGRLRFQNRSSKPRTALAREGEDVSNPRGGTGKSLQIEGFLRTGGHRATVSATPRLCGDRGTGRMENPSVARAGTGRDL